MDKTMPRTRLVLVEDDPDTLEVFSMFFGQKYAVFGYPSAAQALQAIDAAQPDVLVLDIGMRPIDGLQCLQKIRATPGYRDTPAVALTGFARDVERRSFLDGGFQAVVVKPVLDHEELMALIDGLVDSPAPVAPRTPAPPRGSSALPTRPAAAPHLDARATMTASGAGGDGETDGQGPA